MVCYVQPALLPLIPVSYYDDQGQCYQGISLVPNLPPQWYHCDYIPPYPLVYFGDGFRVKGYNGFVLIDLIGDILCAVAPAYGQSYCDCDDVWTCLDDPVVISLKDSQYELTDTKGGVEFDLNGDGETEQIPWTAGKDDAFLVLDRNGNGLIDDGRELFSHVSPQQPSGTPNGFHALRMFDDPLNGGNEDGRINASDEIYGSLRLWLDADHDGSTDAGSGSAWGRVSNRWRTRWSGSGALGGVSGRPCPAGKAVTSKAGCPAMPTSSSSLSGRQSRAFRSRCPTYEDQR